MRASAPFSILLIDDDKRLSAMLAELLDTEGYACMTAANGARGILLLEEHRPDLVVLDVMMPGHDGIATLAEIRRKSAVPVIMLTALGDEEHRIRGLEAGADDYVAKPFAARELLLRIRAVLKRSTENTDAQNAERDPLRAAGPLEVQLNRHRASVGDVSLDLTDTELRILAVLVERIDAVVTRQHLSRYAIGRELMPDDRALDTHISNLRRKIAATGDTNCRIRTVRGSGYRLTVH